VIVIDEKLLHYYVTYSNSPHGDPLDNALRSSGVRYKLFGGKLSLRYHQRWQLLFLGLPRLLWMAVGFAWNSLIKEKERPDIVLVGSHFEAFIFVLSRIILFRRFKLVYLGFIYTRRPNKLLEFLRRAYFSVLFRSVDGVVCYSSHEIDRYSVIFPNSKAKFLFVPYGLNVPGSDEYTAHNHNIPKFFSAGRSGRDYALLTRVFEKNGRCLRIACDLTSMQIGCTVSPNVVWLTSCYGESYLSELRNCSVVVVPLSVDDISAGQMVVLQAMAFGKPVITTKTSTILDYATAQSGVILVMPGDEDDLSKAINRVATDYQLVTDMSSKARSTYLERHTPTKFIENLLKEISRL
jgi:glycosyltransferase involved in cell wall biosynthesis